MSVKRSQDRTPLCTFAYSDGRRCRNPRGPGHPHLCTAHARQEAQALAGDQAGKDIARFLSGEYLSACDLSSALGRLFAAVAQGQIKPETASTLAYLGQTLVQTLTLAQHEYINAFGPEFWRRTVRSSFRASQPPSDPPRPQVLPLPPTKAEFSQQMAQLIHASSSDGSSRSRPENSQQLTGLESTLTEVYENKPL